MTRAAVYLRISSDPSGQQLGVTRQREDCAKLCAAKGWTPVEYLDNDVSASNGKHRPAYEQMLADIESGHYRRGRRLGLGPAAPPTHRVGTLHGLG